MICFEQILLLQFLFLYSFEVVVEGEGGADDLNDCFFGVSCQGIMEFVKWFSNITIDGYRLVAPPPPLVRVC